GEFLYVVGPSGAGKSTFINLMYREEKATSGQIIMNGIDLATLKNKKVPYLRRQFGVVFQDFKLLPRLNVYENVAFALDVIKEQPDEIRRHVMEVLE
ncbi:cell division ATP-binding protein FtsE, partial [Lysinibacillus sp. D4B1_S16]|uniref:cell division ATP-binding protein FtsE n=1 Tax=Lysinibacillus sp. D4B1_S16 TaxID=2941231 RepID=UPI0020BF2A85